MLELSNIINISVNEAPTGLGEFIVNNVALFTTDAFLSNPNSDTYRIYVSASEVGTDFGTNTETYQQALAFFSQQPNPLNGGGSLIIFPLLSGLVRTVAVNAGGSGYAVNDVLTVGADGLTVKVATVSGGVVTGVTIVTPGSGYSVASAQATTGGGGTGCTIDIDSVGGETVVEGVARTKDTTYYCGVISTSYPSSGSMKAAADTIQSYNDKILILPSNTYADVAADFTDIKTAKDTRTRCLYYSVSALDARLFAAAYAGALFSTNFDASNGTLTMNLKQLTTIDPDTGITQTIRDAADSAGVDIYASIAGVPGVLSSGGNDYADNVLGIVWLVNSLKVAGFNALALVSTKIPQTEAGVSVLKTAYRSVCDSAVNNALVAPGKWTDPDTFGVQADFLQNIIDVGYYIYSQPVNLQSAADRTARKAPLIQIAVKLAGALHSSSVIVNVNP